MNDEPISTKKKGSSGRGCMILFGSVFALFGLVFIWMTTINPLLKSRASNDWVETKCTVVTSEIDIDRDSDGTTYRPRIEFDYNYDGQGYHSDTFDFTSLNRSKARCTEIVNDHPVGTQMGCFVNPDDPEEAVIDRRYDFSYMGFIFPLIFSGIGFAILWAAVFWKDTESKTISGSAKRPMSAASSSLTQTSALQPVTEHPGDVDDQTWDEPQKLKPSQTRLMKLILGSVFALFWNGIVGAMLYGFFKDFGNGIDWFFVLFLIPFVLVGLGLIVGVIYLLGGLLNPGVELALSTGAVSRGSSVDVAWQLSGRTSSIQTLKVTVEGEESATYRRGTDTITDTNVFCTIPVTETDSPEEIEFGSVPVTIPADTMHTFAADRNNIKWRIVVHGNIPRWPDIKETFEFRVKP